MIFEAEIVQKTDFHLFYSVEGTKTPDILKNVRLGLGPFKVVKDEVEVVSWAEPTKSGS